MVEIVCSYLAVCVFVCCRLCESVRVCVYVCMCVCVVSVSVCGCVSLCMCVCACVWLSCRVCLFVDTGVLAAIDINTLILDGVVNAR